MSEWKFELNGQPLSALTSGAFAFPAFSGLGAYVNRRSSTCVADLGAIPVGSYYIFDRQSGGLLGPLKDLLNDRSEWFSLFAIDEKIDDETYCDKVKRGSFRLHPKGRLGISEGCITIDRIADYRHLRAILLAAPRIAVPGTSLRAYGRVSVI